MFSGNSYISIHTRLFSETKKHPIETDGVRYVPAPVTGPWRYEPTIVTLPNSIVVLLLIVLSLE